MVEHSITSRLKTNKPAVQYNYKANGDHSYEASLYPLLPFIPLILVFNNQKSLRAAVIIVTLSSTVFNSIQNLLTIQFDTQRQILNIYYIEGTFGRS